MNSAVSLSDIALVSPIIALFLTSLIPITSKVLRGNKEQAPVVTLIQALVGVLIAMGLSLIFGGVGKTAFSGTLIFDGITQWIGLIALGAVGVSLVMMYENPATTGKQFSETIFLALNSAVGMMILVSAVDLLTVFIGLETMSLALYLMIAMSHEEKLSKEAALKYFILGSFASAIFLYGIALVFGSAGSTNIISFLDTAADLVQTNKLFLFGISFVILGFCFKVSIAPFHAWTPDVYQGAPTPLTAFMATAVKAVSFAAFLRVVATHPLLGSVNLLLALQWLAVITMIVGNVAALVQNNVKRMVAFSSIAHSGYLLVGIITAGISENGAFGASGVIFYLLSYAVMTLGSLAIISMMEKSEDDIITVDNLGGFAKRRPILGLCLTVFLLSLAGIPPTLGFFGKFYLFNAAVGEGLIWLALWGMLNSAIGVYYYLRPIVTMYMKDGEGDLAARPVYATTVATVFLALVILLLGVVSGPLLSVMEKSLL